MKTVILAGIIGYFAILILVAAFTGRNSNNNSFFTGGHRSPWFLVAFGMIGASLSGVTFISVPGTVSTQGFIYLQIAIGNLLGYIFNAMVLVPFYYRHRSVSIYSFLEDRLGIVSRRTASFSFLISKMLGASFRLYIVCAVLSGALFGTSRLWILAIAAFSMLITYFYTKKAGIRTLVFTDVLQTIFMLLATLATIFELSGALGFQDGIFAEIGLRLSSGELTLFNFNPHDPKFILKDILSGFVMAIAANGLDQDMMQKNLTCRTMEESRKNICVFSLINIMVVTSFLILGFLLSAYASVIGVTQTGDELFPEIALHHMGLVASLIFIIGMIAACFSSVDSALTAMTTGFCMDFLKMEDNNIDDRDVKRRRIVHLCLAGLMIASILIILNIKTSVINLVLKTAGYTYGPIIGIYAFACFLKRKTKDRAVPFAALISVLLCGFLDLFGPKLFGITFGYEISIINGLVTFLLMLLFSFFSIPGNKLR